MRDLLKLRKRQTAAAIFTDEEIRAIRRADEVGLVTRGEQAETYGVGKETIARICRRDTYRWVGEEVVDREDYSDAEPTEEMREDMRRVLASAIRVQNELRPENLLQELKGE